MGMYKMNHNGCVNVFILIIIIMRFVIVENTRYVLLWVHSRRRYLRYCYHSIFVLLILTTYLLLLTTYLMNDKDRIPDSQVCQKQIL